MQKQFIRHDIACPFLYIVRPNVTQTKNCNVAKLRDSCQVVERPLDGGNTFQPFVPLRRVYVPELVHLLKMLNVSDLLTHYLSLRYLGRFILNVLMLGQYPRNGMFYYPNFSCHHIGGWPDDLEKGVMGVGTKKIT